MKYFGYLVLSVIPWFLLIAVCLVIFVLQSPRDASSSGIHSKERLSINRFSYRKRAADSFNLDAESSYVIEASDVRSSSRNESPDIKPIHSREEATTIESTVSLNLNDVQDGKKTEVSTNTGSKDADISGDIDLTEFKANEERVDPSSSRDSKRYVYLDWPINSELLSYYNYKSLESLLVHSYTENTFIEISIIGNRIADYYKVTNLLSKQTFAKYKKAGYHINTMVHYQPLTLFRELYDKLMDRDQPPMAASARHYPGEVYFQREIQNITASQGTKVKDASLGHIAVWFYGRISRLYSTGGEFYDIHWLHQEPLSKYPNTIEQGAFILPFCYDKKANVLLPRPTQTTLQYKNGEIYLGPSKSFACGSSSILYFPEAQSPVLKCLLSEYDDGESKLHHCFSFGSLHITSPLLKAYEEAMCIKKAFDRCFSETEVTDELRRSPLINSPNINERHYLGTNISLLTKEEAAWAVSMSPILWLGPHAINGQWTQPYPGTYFHDEITQTSDKFKEKSQKYFQSLGYSPIKSCSPYQIEDYYDQRYKNQAQASCSLSFVMPGFMKAGSTYLFDLLTKHPQILMTLKGVGFKEAGCYYMEQLLNNRSHHRMNCYPFVEANQNFIFGDATVYYIQRYPVARYLKRENPNIKTIIILRDPIKRAESHHRYSYRQYGDHGLANMNDVVDLALCPGYPLDTIYQLATDVLTKYAANEGGQDELQRFLDKVSRFFSPRRTDLVVNATYQRAANTLFFSLYFHPIYIWDQIMGAENIYVVEAERLSDFRSARKLNDQAMALGLDSYKALKPSILQYSNFELHDSLEEELEKLFRFLNVTPLKNIPTLNKHESLDAVPKEHRLSDSGRGRLETFFKPFNELLKLYLKHRRKSNQIF